MSWKSYLTASLLCALASPALANPSANVTRNLADAVTGVGTQSQHYLDANGNWVWVVQVSTSSPIPTGSTALAAEIGLTASGAPAGDTPLRTASLMSTLGSNVNFDTLNPGTPIFTWENPGTGTNNNPEGLQSNCATVGTYSCTESTPGTAPNTVFAALGSQVFLAPTTAPFIQVITRGPSAGAGGVVSSTLTMSGAYAGKARIAEAATGTPPAVNYDANFGPFTRTTVGGDANLSGVVDDGDLNIVLSNLNKSVLPTYRWYHGNFTNHLNSTVDDGDLNIVLTVLNKPAGIQAIGNGAGSGSAVPEPSTLALLGLAIIGSLGLGRHKR